MNTKNNSIQNLQKCSKKQSIFHLLWTTIGPQIITILIISLILIMNWYFVTPFACNSSIFSFTPNDISTFWGRSIVSCIMLLVEIIIIMGIFAIAFLIVSLISAIKNSICFVHRLIRLPLTKAELDTCNIKTILDYDHFLNNIRPYRWYTLWDVDYPEKIAQQIISSILELFTEDDIKEYIKLTQNIDIRDEVDYCYIRIWLNNYTDYNIYYQDKNSDLD